jgi:hypothetical protein
MIAPGDKIVIGPARHSGSGCQPLHLYFHFNVKTTIAWRKIEVGDNLAVVVACKYT